MGDRLARVSALAAARDGSGGGQGVNLRLTTRTESAATVPRVDERGDVARRIKSVKGTLHT